MRRCIWLVIWAVSRLGRTKAAPMDQIAFVEPQGWQQDQLVRVQHANASQFRELLEVKSLRSQVRVLANAMLVGPGL